MVAPNTLRTPISLVRCSATNEANPNKPKQLIRIANKVNTRAKLATRSSEANFAAYYSSIKSYWNGRFGKCALNVVSIMFKFSETLLLGLSLKL